MSTFLRAPVAFLTPAAALMTATNFGGQNNGIGGGPVYIVPQGAQSQQGAALGSGQISPNLLPSALFSAASQKITFAADAWLVITPIAFRQIVSGLFPTFDLSRLPSEPLQLSQECVVNAQGGWPAVFTALGFTAYTPTVGAVPTMNC